MARRRLEEGLRGPVPTIPEASLPEDPIEAATDLDRRSFLRHGALALGGAALSLPLQGLFARQARGSFADSPIAGPYGPVRPTRDRTTGLELLQLPPGFRYRSMGWTGDLLADGTATPSNHDGMGVVARIFNRTGDLVLIRNHEIGFGDILGGGVTAPVYDDVRFSRAVGQSLADLFGVPGPARHIGGGVTRLTVRRGRLIHAEPALAGTGGNCSGGVTPWESWLSCEEVTIDGEMLGAKKHGFVFEVPALGAASGRPIREMGFFRHEAAAVDPWTSIVYLTEDNGPECGFYRFRPDDVSQQVGSLEGGGSLEMLKIRGMDGVDLRMARQGDRFPVEWVPVPEPDANPPTGSLIFDGQPSGPYLKGRDQGAALFARLEGCWYGNDVVYFVDTAGGAAAEGTVWCYEPPKDELLGTGRLTALFVSNGPAAGNNSDNLTVSPRGGLLFCEESGPPTRLMGVTADGCSYVFAANNVLLEDAVPDRPAIAPGDYRGSEWAGACFDPSGRILFANVYSPGITFAISGPWRNGPLG